MAYFLDWYRKFYPVENCPPMRRVAIHIVFWIVYSFSFSFALIVEHTLGFQLLICYFTLCGIPAFYSLVYLAIPNLLSPKRFLFGIIILLFIFFVFYCMILYGYYLGFKNNYYEPKSYLYQYINKTVDKGVLGFFNQENFVFELKELFNVLLFPLTFKFIRINRRFYLRNEKLIIEKNDAEIAFLRMQLNPHFFLNSLNNIYSQIITKDETAGDSVMVLSDLMKYILYHSGEQKVDLEREIHFIRNYIDLEKLKGNRFLKINYTEEGDTKGYQIAPLILVNFFENAFKHSSNHHGEVTTIDVNIKCIDTTLYMSLKNDFLEKNNPNIASKESGVGIENTIKRLNLLYPNRHNLTINKENGKFLVELMIRL